MLEAFLDTLERIPDDIVLSVMTRDLNLEDGPTCFCGWSLREKMARLANKDASEVEVAGVVYGCAQTFGGTFEEWEAIYFGVTDSRAPIIERALAIRVLEAVQ